MEASLPSDSAHLSAKSPPPEPHPLHIAPISSNSPPTYAPPPIPDLGPPPSPPSSPMGAELGEGEGSINMETMHELDALEMELEEEEVGFFIMIPYHWYGSVYDCFHCIISVYIIDKICFNSAQFCVALLVHVSHKLKNLDIYSFVLVDENTLDLNTLLENPSIHGLLRRSNLFCRYS